jgi:hypothetical protein
MFAAAVFPALVTPALSQLQLSNVIVEEVKQVFCY